MQLLNPLLIGLSLAAAADTENAPEIEVKEAETSESKYYYGGYPGNYGGYPGYYGGYYGTRGYPGYYPYYGPRFYPGYNGGYYGPRRYGPRYW